MASFRESNFAAGQVLTAAELNAGLTYTDYTPTWTQSTTITKTVNFARYTQFGKMVHVSVKMTATGSGTATNNIAIGLPVTASANNFVMGSAMHLDESTANDDIRTFIAVYNTSSSVIFMNTASFNGTHQYFGVNQSITIASGDVMWMSLIYEAS